MKWEAHPASLVERQRVLHIEDISSIIVCNYPSDLRQFITWCKRSWHTECLEAPFTPQAVISPLLFHYWTSLQTAIRLKPIMTYARYAQLVDVSLYNLRHRFGYLMAEVVSLYRLAQIMDHDSLNTTMFYLCGMKQNLQRDVEKIAWT